MNKRILLIEDDMNICRLLVSCLQDSTTDVKYLLSVNDALDSLFRHWYCLIILDLELRDADGVALLQTLREHHTIPVLVLSENSSVDAKAAMLLAGADDYLTKPFDERECLAKAQALIRRYTELGVDVGKPYALCMGGTFIIDPQYRCVTFEGNFIQLCRKEFDILYFLMLHRRQVFSHEQLYEKVWKEDTVMAEKTTSVTVRYNGLSEQIKAAKNVFTKVSVQKLSTIKVLQTEK